MTFTSKANQAGYFINKASHAFNDFTYVKEDGSIKVPKSRDSLYACNYLMFRNSDFSGKWFYAFITKLEYINPDTTKIYFELDVFQTWQFDFTFKPSFVEREHCKRWNADGSPVINTIDEGLDYGTEYKTVAIENFKPYDDLYFLVMVSKSTMHTTPEGSNKIKPNLNGMPQPLNYYVHPFKLDGSMPNVMHGGTAYQMSPILSVLKGLYTQDDAVNNVVSIYITDYYDNVSYVPATDTISFSSEKYERAGITDDVNENVWTLYVSEIKNFRSTVHSFGNKYDGYTDVTESKLLMHPYTTLIIDDFKGNRLELKNEYLKNNNLTLRYRGALGTSNKVSYQVEGYATDLTDQMNGYETSIINNSPNDVPILAEMLSAYLQGNKNALENQRSSMIFSGTLNTITGAIQGASTGGKLGAVTGAGVAAANSYYQIEGLNAKRRDIVNTPPSLGKMGGNAAFDYGNGLTGIFIIKKEIMPEYRKRLSDFFKMFGYKVNELKTPNYKSRQHFNYLKTVGANVTGNVPHEDLAIIKRMFDTGVTLWHTPDVGNYGLINNEV